MTENQNFVTEVPGIGKKGAEVRWGVAGRMVLAWMITFPMAAVAGAVTWSIGDLVGGVAGAIAVFAILVALSTLMYLRSRHTPVDHHNVNDAWESGATSDPEPAVADR